MIIVCTSRQHTAVVACNTPRRTRPNENESEPMQGVEPFDAELLTAPLQLDDTLIISTQFAGCATHEAMTTQVTRVLTQINALLIGAGTSSRHLRYIMCLLATPTHYGAVSAALAYFAWPSGVTPIITPMLNGGVSVQVSIDLAVHIPSDRSN